jgi:uncharacterized protein
MSSEDNVQVVRDMYAAYGRGDMPQFLAAFSDDVDWDVCASMLVVPLLGPRRGRSAVEEYFSLIDATEDVLEFEPRELIAQDNRVVALGIERVRVKATQRTYENEWAMVFKVDAGRIVHFRGYYDTAAISVGHGALALSS